LRDRRGWHFPQADDGRYAGHYPASSAEAIAELEALRERGASFLVFPDPSRWWLSHYVELREHLERRYRVECADELGIVYRLEPDANRKEDRNQEGEALSSDLFLRHGRGEVGT